MATKKRASTREQLLKRALKAGRLALRNAEKRVPPDLRKQIERSVADGQKTVHAAIVRVQTQLDRTARQTDLDKVLKRLEAISKQVQQVARAAAAGATAQPPPRKAARARKTATRKPAAARAARSKAPASTRPAARRTASRSRTAVRSVPPPPERIEPGDIST